MPRLPRISRRTALLGALAVAPVAVAIVVAIVASGGGSGPASAATPAASRSPGSTAAGGSATGVALPMHPVAGNFKPNQVKLADCKDGEQICYEQAFGNLAFYEGPKAALDVFDQKIADGGPIESGCHRIAHAIGSASLARYHGDVARTFAEGRASCWSGYYHGVLERAFAHVRSFDAVSLGKVARGLCDDASVRRITWLAYQCVHGLGHGLMIHTGYDLPLALDTCDQLATAWDQTSCKGGVFMENISTSYGVKSRWIKDSDPVYPCDVVDENDKLYCYLMVTSHILRVDKWDWEKTAQTCAKVEKGWVDTCFQSFGRDASGSSRQDPDRIKELCAVARPYGGEADCISAAAKDMTANYASGKEASGLCISTDASLRGGCFYAIGSIMGSFKATEAERRADCAAITDVARYAAQCVRGSLGLAPPAATQ
jgi:hypothetical protein